MIKNKAHRFDLSTGKKDCDGLMRLKLCEHSEPAQNRKGIEVRLNEQQQKSTRKQITNEIESIGIPRSLRSLVKIEIIKVNQGFKNSDIRK